MSEFTIIDPQKRPQSYIDGSIGHSFSVEKNKEGFSVKKQKIELRTGFNEENDVMEEEISVHMTGWTQILPTTMTGQAANDFPPILNSAEDRGVENSQEIPSEFNATTDQNHHSVPRDTLSKKYDTTPPPWTPDRDELVAAAERLISRGHKRVLASDSSDTDSEYQCFLGPASKRRKKDNPKHPHYVKPRKRQISKLQKPSDKKATGSSLDRILAPLPAHVPLVNYSSIISGRTMITSKNQASKIQKLFVGFPDTQAPFPADFTLTELCTYYPNRLFGDNLHAFLQHKWSASRIWKLFPDQSGVAEEQRVTANAIASRLRKRRTALEKSGEYTDLMNDPKAHAEL